MMYTYFPEGPGGTTERETQMYTTFGDPELDPWTAVPESLDVTHPDFVLVGEWPFTVTVELNGQPLKDALVCLIKDSEVYESARTGPDGQVTLTPAPATPGTMDLTVTAHNAYPYETTIEVIALSGPYLVYHSLEIDDDSLGASRGNGDGDVDFAETIEMPIGLRNLGDSTAHNVHGTLSTTHPLVSVIDDSAFWGEIPSESTVVCQDVFVFYVSPEIPDQEVISFHLDVQATNGEWSYDDLSVVAHAPILVYESKETDDVGGNDNGKPDPGETCNMTVTLRNDGSEGELQVSAELLCDDPYVTVTAFAASYPDISAGGTGSSLTPYQFEVGEDCPQGHLATMILQISGWGLYSTEDTFEVLIGQKPILLVDDDGGGSYESYFLTALDSVGLAYDVWTYETFGAPTDSLLEQYQAVVWTTGPDYGTIGDPQTLTATDQERLMTYLDDGGSIFLSSQDLLYDNNLNTFITDYLHVAGRNIDENIHSVAGMSDDTISDGMSFNLSYPFYNLSDCIVPGSGATGIFSQTGKASSAFGEGVPTDRLSGAGSSGLLDSCALRYPASGQSTYKVVFFAFPFEAVPQTGSYPDNSYTLMRRIMGWFGVGVPPASFMHGDANGDGIIDLADVLYLINYLYKGGPAPDPLEAGDADCDGMVDLEDVLYLINYLYKGGTPPPC